MNERMIPQRELRNNIAEVLRQAEAGVEFTITVRGRPVASLGPPRDTPARVDIDLREIAEMLIELPPVEHFAVDLAALRDGELPVDNPWPT